MVSAWQEVPHPCPHGVEIVRALMLEASADIARMRATRATMPSTNRSNSSGVNQREVASMPEVRRRGSRSNRSNPQPRR